jgi:signal transduction histidine kinase
MTRRWRLFPKYALLIITLVGGMLVASGAIGIYFSWGETEDHLVALQIEKAESAATRIEQYVRDIEHEMSWTALPRTEGDNALEQRRIEYLKLLRQAPAITEVVWIDAAGREQLRVSRLAMDAVSSGIDLSAEPKFRAASVGHVYYGPVYFRKGTEPYLTIARPAGSGGGVTAAEVNLKFVWEVVSKIKIGAAGLAYVVDATDTLIAHPDISLVLKKSDLSALPQVAALARPNDIASPLGRDLKGDEVFAAHATIPTLHWTVFVESPRAEAFAPLYATLKRTALVLVAALLISIAASFFLARALVRPLRALQEGAAQIGAGDLDRHIEVRTGDELEGLAEQFNHMSAQLRESYAGLERKVEQRTSELTEALEYQTATAEILKVISSSPDDLQPVLEAVAERSRILCRAAGSRVWLLDDSPLLARHLRARTGYKLEDGSESGRGDLLPLKATSVVGQAFVEARTVHIDDVAPLIDKQYPDARASQERHGFRTVLAVPMLREGNVIGVIAVLRKQVEPFSSGEIRLIETFADQALIAMVNVHLFNETKEALQQQTATAEVLRVISGSIADSAPVFEKILDSCQRLFASSEQGVLLVGEDGRFHLGAHHGNARALLEKLFPVSRDVGGVASDERHVIHIKDILGDAGVPPGLRTIAERIGVGTYSQVIAPMLWEGESIGSLYVIRQPAVGFSEKEIGLLRTFADQAVIAIQNARLFSETKEALEQQTATAEVLQVISSSVADAQPVFDKILDSCERLFAATGLGIYLVDDAGLLQRGAFRRRGVGAPIPAGGAFPRPVEGTATAIAIEQRRVIHYPNVLAAADAPPTLRRMAAAVGNYSIALAPMLWEDRGVGTIQVTRDPPAPFSDKELTLLKTFADQAVIAIQNARLFNEIKSKSRELEMANKHKSEFLANMSHELRTPLNAIIGFSEVLSEKMFGEVNDKQLEYLLDINSSGHHLLSLINDILDLSKIEAGRMELDLATTSLPMLLDNCTTLVRERANRQGLVLALEVEDGLGDWVADIRKLKQVVINLLSNAVKFTPAGGRVTLRARRLEHAVEIAVVDTGVGIAEDQQALVFEEFRQAGGDYLRKSEGTGLGLSLAKRFVELHGGTIRVESAPGRGSTFAFILPERVLEAV